MIRLCLLALFLLTSQAHAQEDRARTSGLALGGGAGFENAGLGGHVMYYLQLSERWRLAPFAGIGYFGRIAGSGGVQAMFGRRHRLVLGLMGSPVAAQGGTNSPTYVYYGVSPVVGWEWMSSRGLALRSSVGVAFHIDDPGDPVFLALNVLSIVGKLW